MTKAETGSLFLLDPDGVVRDCILTRDPGRRKSAWTSPVPFWKAVLPVGWCAIAGIGLITDTEKDERWLKLPDQPYAARSAMAVPIIRDNEMLGILTLLIPSPGSSITARLT